MSAAHSQHHEGPAIPPGTTTLPISSLLPADSPRIDGENLDHVRALAETGSELPPILVHRTSMRIIDGMHRVRAALLRGADSIEVRFIEGADMDVFLLGVEANLTHGLPLSLADRKAAARRTVDEHPDWSDRAIGVATGISAKTVGTIRRRSAAHIPHPNTRLGRDGRSYPVDAGEGQRRAGEIVTAQPDASVREIARSAGISVGAAHKIRTRMRQSHDADFPAAAPRRRAGGADPPGAAAPSGQPVEASVDWDALSRRLRKDPTLKYSEPGRLLLQILDACAVDQETWQTFANVVPTHWADLIARVAHSYADHWQTFARTLEQREPSDMK